MSFEHPPSREESASGERETESVHLERWDGPFSVDDPNANFKADVALHAQLDPMTTVRGLAEAVGLPVGAVARYVLAKYATGGSGGLLEIGPSMVHRLWEPIARAEEADEDRARLEAYGQLRQMISWLRAPLLDGNVAVTASEEESTQTRPSKSISRGD